MAIDTRSKRASSIGILLGFCVLAPVAPDGTISSDDRRHIAWSYSGIAAASAARAPDGPGGCPFVGGTYFNGFFYGLAPRRMFKIEAPATSSLMPLTVPGLVVSSIFAMVEW